ncbi:unnamed protein product [Adineta steineri]|uniref:Uncharacterized protein n=1 Tax=Adineta steineri TaxID=433720 RepID=A0A818I490_9BILA|nr:unnamed protein product [Adineta steineri]CAF3517244.1 unnamed protein product [Adineta steineri]
MNRFGDPSIVSHYQFTRSSGATSRPQSSLPSKDAVTDMFNVGIDNRNQLHRSDSPVSSSSKRIVRHPVHIPTASVVVSPPILNERSSTPDQNLTPDRPSSAFVTSRFTRSMPVRLKSTAILIPISSNAEPISYQNFPKHNHEKRKVVNDKKRKKQQKQMFFDRQSETETWHRLRRSLVELKRLAATQDILISPSMSHFHCDGYTCTTLKETINEQQEEKKAASFKSESGMSSSFGAVYSSRELPRSNVITSKGTLYRSSLSKRPTEIYPKIVFEPLLVASKPIHYVTDKSNPPIKSRLKPPATAPSRSHSNYTIGLSSEEKQPDVFITDHSNDDNRSLPSTPPPPPITKTDQDIPPRKIVTPISTRMRPPSTLPINSTIKLKSQVARCRSATESKSSYTPMNKNNPRFIIIADEEHRIESWYHQYPFVLSDDLVSSFESKQSQQKVTISAYFIDDLQMSNPNITAKTFLQGKPFHINNDWKKYDVIFISNNIYEQVMIYLKTIVNLMKSSGKIVKIYQIKHDEDLKKQVRNICKQLQQQNI